MEFKPKNRIVGEITIKSTDEDAIDQLATIFERGVGEYIIKASFDDTMFTDKWKPSLLILKGDFRVFTEDNFSDFIKKYSLYGLDEVIERLDNAYLENLLIQNYFKIEFEYAELIGNKIYMGKDVLYHDSGTALDTCRWNNLYKDEMFYCWKNIKDMGFYKDYDLFVPKLLKGKKKWEIRKEFQEQFKHGLTMEDIVNNPITSKMYERYVIDAHR